MTDSNDNAFITAIVILMVVIGVLILALYGASIEETNMKNKAVEYGYAKLIPTKEDPYKNQFQWIVPQSKQTLGDKNDQK